MKLFHLIPFIALLLAVVVHATPLPVSKRSINHPHSKRAPLGRGFHQDGGSVFGQDGYDNQVGKVEDGWAEKLTTYDASLTWKQKLKQEQEQRKQQLLDFEKDSQQKMKQEEEQGKQRLQVIEKESQQIMKKLKDQLDQLNEAKRQRNS